MLVKGTELYRAHKYSAWMLKSLQLVEGVDMELMYLVNLREPNF